MENNIYLISVHSDNEQNIYRCIVRDKPTEKDLKKLEKKIKKEEDLNSNCYAEIEFQLRADELVSIKDILQDLLEHRTRSEILQEAING